jgi:glucan-binding YG repeat protein
MKDKMCKMKNEDTTTHEEVVKEEKINETVSDLDEKYAEVVEKFITKEWGDSDWEKGFIKCMIGYTASLSKETKEIVIENDPEKAFSKISNEEDQMIYNKVFQACEKNSEAALKVAQESQSQSSETSSEYSSEAELKSSIVKLEEYLVETSDNFKKTMMHYMADSSCAAKTKNTTKYQNEANKKARKAVADFFISAFEITPL